VLYQSCRRNGSWEGAQHPLPTNALTNVHVSPTDSDDEVNEMPHFIQQQVRGQNAVVEVLGQREVGRGCNTPLRLCSTPYASSTPPLHGGAPVSLLPRHNQPQAHNPPPFCQIFQFSSSQSKKLPACVAKGRVTKTCGRVWVCLSVPDALSLTIRRLFVCNVGFSLAVVSSIQR
jgi:hypothetical protein